MSYNNEKIQQFNDMRPKLFTEFGKKEKDKIAAMIEQKSTEFFIAPAVEQYVYFVSRALDFGDFHGTLNKKASWEHAVNRNSDLFNYDELMDKDPHKGYERYLTFRTASVFLNHNSSNPENAIGLVFDSTMFKDPYEDMHITILMGVDKRKSPGVARTLQLYPTRVGTSMGCSIKSSSCTVCGKKIVKEADTCSCLKHHRGGRLKGKKVAELLEGISFYEQSIVQVPACPTAYVIDAISELVPGRLLKVASDNKDVSENINLINSVYTAIKQADTLNEKKRLNNQLDYLINKLEGML